MMRQKNFLRPKTPSILFLAIATLVGADVIGVASPAYGKVVWAATATKAYQAVDALPIRPVVGSEFMHVVVALKLQNRAELDSTVRASRSSAGAGSARRADDLSDLGKYLPTLLQANEVAHYLSSSGFKNVKVSRDRLLVTADGTTSIVESAFNTKMMYEVRNGRSGFANQSPAQVPQELSGTVMSILGLQTVEELKPQVVFGGHPPSCVPVAVIRTPLECGLNPPASGLDPTIFPGVYGVASLPTGANTSVGIIAEGSLSQTITDLQKFESQNSLPKISPSVVLAGAASTDVSGTAEWDIDSQTIQSVAGGHLAALIFYVATTLGDADLTSAYDKALTAGVAKIVNVSLGECELDANSDGSAAADDQIFELAMSRGQTFSVASGDNGSAECGASAGMSYPASSQYVLAIGGTTLTTSNGSYVSETAWSGSGGGPSQIESQPPWQTGIVPGTARGIPDLSFDSDPNTGIVIVLDGAASGPWGGTSVASPIFVGLFARLQSIAGNTLPFPSQWIYHFPLGRRSTSFHDVIKGSNGGYSAGTGWDYTTGFGSLIGQNAYVGIGVLPLAAITNYVLSPN